MLMNIIDMNEKLNKIDYFQFDKLKFDFGVENLMVLLTNAENKVLVFFLFEVSSKVSIHQCGECIKGN